MIPVGLIVALGFLALTALFYATVWGLTGLYWGVCWLVASRLTPKGHNLFGTYKGTKAAQELRSQGYGITPDWRSDALSHLPKS